MARNSRPRVCRLILTPNSSQSHCARSTRRQRTTPSRYGLGPSSTAFFSAARCASPSREGGPELLRLISPSGPSALKAYHPVTDDLQPYARQTGRLAALSAVIDLRQRNSAVAIAPHPGTASPTPATTGHQNHLAIEPPAPMPNLHKAFDT